MLMSSLHFCMRPTVNSLLTDTSLKRTRGVSPCRTSVIYFISLQGGHLSKADSRSWSPVRLRGSWLHMAAFQQSRTEVKNTSLSVVKTAVHAGALDSKPLYSFQETKEQRCRLGAAPGLVTWSCRTNFTEIVSYLMWAPLQIMGCKGSPNLDRFLPIAPGSGMEMLSLVRSASWWHVSGSSPPMELQTPGPFM